MSNGKDDLQRLLELMHGDVMEALTSKKLSDEVKLILRRMAKRCLTLSQQLGKTKNPAKSLINRIWLTLSQLATLISLANP